MTPERVLRLLTEEGYAGWRAIEGDGAALCNKGSCFPLELRWSEFSVNGKHHSWSFTLSSPENSEYLEEAGSACSCLRLARIRLQDTLRDLRALSGVLTPAKKQPTQAEGL